MRVFRDCIRNSFLCNLVTKKRSIKTSLFHKIHKKGKKSSKNMLEYLIPKLRVGSKCKRHSLSHSLLTSTFENIISNSVIFIFLNRIRKCEKVNCDGIMR